MRSDVLDPELSVAYHNSLFLAHVRLLRQANGFPSHAGLEAGLLLLYGFAIP